MTMIDNAEMGDDNTILGPVPHKMGSRNTIVADADANGNVIHNRGGTAIGYGARADSTSVAIGGRAMGGDLPQLADLLAQLGVLFGQTGDTETATAVAQLAAEVQAPSREGSRIRKAWEGIRLAATTNEAVSLVARITPLLPLHHL
jgi:hypothetical protein